VIIRKTTEKVVYSFGKRVEKTEKTAQPKPALLALPAPNDVKPAKAFDFERMKNLSKPRERTDDPNIKPEPKPPKKKRISRKQMLDRALRVKQRQEKAMTQIEKKKE
jgi:hypothetical protein